MRKSVPFSPRGCAAVGVLFTVGLGARLCWAQSTATATAGASPWTVSGQLLQGVDSNVFLSPTQPQADSTSQLQLNLGGHWSGPRWSFLTSYTPQAEAYARNARLDYIGQSYTQDWEYAWSPYTQLSWTANAARYPERGGMPQSGSANLAAVATASQAMALASILTSAASSLNLSHQYSLRASWTVSLSANEQAFSPDSALLASPVAGTPQSAQKAQSRSLGGTLGWSYQLTERRSVRLSAMDNELWFTNPAQHVRYVTLQASLQQQLGSFLTLGLGAGPAWSEPQVAAGVIAASSLPSHSYSANASLTATHGRSQYGVSWQHSDQLGLIPGGVTTDVEALQYSLSWGRSWSTAWSIGRSAGTLASEGPGIGAFNGTANQDSSFASGQLRYQVSSDWSLLSTASFSGQTLPAAPGSIERLRRGQLSFGIAFNPEGAR